MNTEQYINLLKYLRSMREDIKKNYLIKIHDIFHESSQNTSNNQSRQSNLTEVSLMSDDAVKENHVIDLIIRQCEHIFYEDLTNLNVHIAKLFDKHAIENGQNPILPERLVRALFEVVKPLDLNADSRIALYKTFDVNVFSQLGFIYRELLDSAKQLT